MSQSSVVGKLAGRRALEGEITIAKKKTIDPEHTVNDEKTIPSHILVMTGKWRNTSFRLNKSEILTPSDRRYVVTKGESRLQ